MANIFNALESSYMSWIKSLSVSFLSISAAVRSDLFNAWRVCDQLSEDKCQVHRTWKRLTSFSKITEARFVRVSCPLTENRIFRSLRSLSRELLDIAGKLGSSWRTDSSRYLPGSPSILSIRGSISFCSEATLSLLNPLPTLVTVTVHQLRAAVS